MAETDPDLGSKESPWQPDQEHLIRFLKASLLLMALIMFVTVKDVMHLFK